MHFRAIVLLTIFAALPVGAEPPSVVPLISGVQGSAAVLAMAAPAAEAASDPARALVEKMAQPGGRIVREFDSGVGLKGFVVEHPQTKKSALIYVDPQGRYLLSGLLFDGAGGNLSSSHFDEFVPKPDATAIIRDAETTAWVEDGRPDAKAVLYVLGEPNCGYCKLFYAQTRAAVAKGDVALRWIMVGFDPVGKQKSADIFTAADMGKAFNDMYGKGAAVPGATAGRMVTGPRPIVEAPPQAIARNEAYAAKHGIQGTPHVIYRTQSGAVQLSAGVPQPAAMTEILRIATR